jgi:hypothetical protein
MTFVSRTLPSTVGAGQSVSAATNRAEEIRSAPWLFDKALEGSVYIAGHGLEETATDGEASLDETTPSFMLMAPTSGTIVVPIWAEMRTHTEGGAAPDIYLSYVGVDRTSGVTYTSLDKLQMAGTATTSSAIAAKTISTVTAITSAQTVLLARRANILDNLISVEMATTGTVEAPGANVLGLEFDFWNKFHGAFVLKGGTSIMLHTSTGTSDSAYSVTFCWAEIPASTYGLS